MPYLWAPVIIVFMSLCLIPHHFHRLTGRSHIVRLGIAKCGEEKTAHVLNCTSAAVQKEPPRCTCDASRRLGFSIRIRGMKLRSKYCGLGPTQIATHPTHSPAPKPYQQQSIFPSLQ